MLHMLRPPYWISGCGAPFQTPPLGAISFARTISFGDVIRNFAVEKRTKITFVEKNELSSKVDFENLGLVYVLMFD